MDKLKLILIGYYNNYIDENHLKNQIEDLIDDKTILDLYLSSNDSDFETNFANLFCSVFSISMKNYEKVRGYSIYDYNFAEDEIRKYLRYWRTKDLLKLKSVKNNKLLVKNFLEISETFNFPNDFPYLNLKFEFEVDENIQNTQYIEKIDKDCSKISKFIDEEMEFAREVELLLAVR